MTHRVILVHTTSSAIRVEKLLKKAGLEVKLVPVPRHLSSDCGVSVRIAAADEERCREILAGNCVEFERIEPIR